MNDAVNQDSTSPDLSIIIPTYNRRELLEEALNSFVGLLACSYEVIIVDDGSTDGTRDYLQKLENPIRVFFQEHKRGNAARNYGLREARGRYVKFLDDDDWLIASMVDQQVRFLNLHEEIEICYSDYGFVYSNGSVQIHSTTLNTSLENLLVGMRRHHIGHPNYAYTFRREAASRVEWDETLSSSQDTDYFLRSFLEGTSFGYLPGCAGWVRHDRQRLRVSFPSNSEKQAENQRNMLIILRKVHTILTARSQMSPSMRQTLAQRYFWHAERLYRFSHNSEEFRNWLDTVLELDPDFRPSGRVFPLLTRLFGYETAIRLREMRVSWKANVRGFLEKLVP